MCSQIFKEEGWRNFTLKDSLLEQLRWKRTSDCGADCSLGLSFNTFWPRIVAKFLQLRLDTLSFKYMFYIQRIVWTISKDGKSRKLLMLSSESNTPWGGCCGQLAREGGVEGATCWEEAEGPGGAGRGASSRPGCEGAKCGRHGCPISCCCVWLTLKIK